MLTVQYLQDSKYCAVARDSSDVVLATRVAPNLAKTDTGEWQRDIGEELIRKGIQQLQYTQGLVVSAGVVETKFCYSLRFGT